MKIKIGVAVGLMSLWFAAGAHAQPAATAAAELPESEPLVRTWVPPVYPAELKEAGVTGDVTVYFIVDEKGAVSAVRAQKSSDPRFEKAAVESVSQWTFDAGVEMGERAAMGMSVRLNFKLPEPKAGLLPPNNSTPHPLSKTDAKADSPPDPAYPADLFARQISGAAVVDYVVEPDGRITGVRLRDITHPGFVRPVLAAVEKMTFTPAKQGDLSVRAKMRSPIEFEASTMNIGERAPPQLALNGFAVRTADGQEERDLCDKPPQLWSVPDVAFPREAAVEGRAGEATVFFDLTERGQPENLQLVSASAPEFGQRLMDTLAAGTFKPAMKDGRTVAVPMQWTHVFALPAADAPENEAAEARLIRVLRSGTAIGTAKGLDVPLKPLWRVAAPYPEDLRASGSSGSAQVEFIIDQEGRVRLPRVVSATEEKFGRAALIAATLWVFDPPMRGGKPVDVRVRLPFQFAP